MSARHEKHDRDRLREMWRLAAAEWSAAEDNASRLEEGRKIIIDEMVLNLTEGDGAMAASKAERVARTSEQFKGYLRKMHDARRQANDARIAMQDADRRYWESVSVEANERAERRMSR